MLYAAPPMDTALEALRAPRPRPSSDVLVHDTFDAAAACAASAAGSFLFGDAPPVEAEVGVAAAAAPAEAEAEGRRKRRRRARSVKSREDAESQRMTHIAIERNRRRQMNEYLGVLRSLMPESYVHRSDQASIVSGAIDFVKELEQQLQSLEARKLALQRQRGDTAAAERDAADQTGPRDPAAATSSFGESASATEEAAAAPAREEEPRPFARFFRYPQYAWRHAPPPRREAEEEEEEASRAPGVLADVEVGVVVDGHACLRVMAPRRPGQLLRMVAGLQALGFAVIHLSVTTALDAVALYTLSLKVEDGSGLTTSEDIAAAVHHVLCIDDAEATAQRPLAAGQAQPDL